MASNRCNKHCTFSSNATISVFVARSFTLTIRWRGGAVPFGSEPDSMLSSCWNTGVENIKAPQTPPNTASDFKIISRIIDGSTMLARGQQRRRRRWAPRNLFFKFFDLVFVWVPALARSAREREDLPNETMVEVVVCPTFSKKRNETQDRRKPVQPSATKSKRSLRAQVEQQYQTTMQSVRAFGMDHPC